ncbi:MAG: hypothetical protein QM820_29540 [Minicystis sp.]
MRKTDTTPPPPIVVVSEAPRPPPPPPAPAHREPGHEIALRRLQFLTAVPSMDRQHEPEWPDGYVAAATAGLTLTEHERRHLRMVAASFVRGHHNPLPHITTLVKSETPDALNAIVASFRHLNRSAPDQAEEVLQWLHELSGGHPPAPPAHAQVHAPRSHVHAPAPARAPAHPSYAATSSPAPPPRVVTVATPRAAPAAPKQAHDEAHTNVRSLGALDDMFKD